MYLTYEKETFVKTGRTTWGLAIWSDVAEAGIWNTEQIADFVANIFRSNKAKELSYKMLKGALMKEMGINRNQAQGLLSHNPVIKTRSKTAWGEITAVFQPNYKAILAQAKLNAPLQRISLHKQVEESAYKILNAAPDKQMPIAELVMQLHKQLECSASTAYNYLMSLDSVERIDIPGSIKKICRLKEGIASNTASGGNLHQRVSKSVRIILETVSNKQMLMSELIKLVQREVSCPKATLYQYIGNLDYIERVDIPNSHAKLYRMKDTPRADLFPQVQSINNSTLREKVDRALPFLTEENVDIGLFLLSKEFEATLKTYLTRADVRGKLQSLPPGRSPDKWTLNGMVECAKDNDIITDHAVFHYLRQSRNDRAHGSMPSSAERQLLMKSVQYIAGLYIDYIKLLDDLTQNL